VDIPVIDWFGGHYAVEYWKACPMPTMQEFTVEEFKRLHKEKYKFEPSFKEGRELLNSGGWTAHMRTLGIWFNRGVSVSVVTKARGNGKDLISLMDGKINSQAVKNKWEIVKKVAASYKFAEHANDQAAFEAAGGPIKNWPNSRYFLPIGFIQNNSNVFARWLVLNSGLPLLEIKARWHPPIQNAPVPVPAGDYKGNPWR
jgi:hypothetical protein